MKNMDDLVFRHVTETQVFGALHLCACSVTEFALRDLGETSPGISSLVLQRCPYLSDRGLRFFLAAAREVDLVVLAACRSVVDVEALRLEHPRTRFVALPAKPLYDFA